MSIFVDVIDQVNFAQSLRQALNMAIEGAISMDKEEQNALHAINRAVEDKLNLVKKMLEAVMQADGQKPSQPSDERRIGVGPAPRPD